MEVANVVLSKPLQQLKDEHVELMMDMNLFYDIAEEIDFGSGNDVVQLFMELYEKVLIFVDKLEIHANREENVLFPMMSQVLGMNDKTIEQMEYEHEKAERHLQDFLTEAAQVDSSLDEHDAQSISVHAVQAYATLTQHFAKEEKVLFPLAEKILSEAEKKKLEQLLQTINTAFDKL
ncbi:hemerythrin domain-containing protein [Aquibacillus kalidii]|uniref:hemerythrin domain-containing protein n=1 Tax=Aquibacillus kalidii TaxID=2762597 RepID=UPI0016457EEC|nr:hemerythrin domain-containing protein [Aquibacillus kalidii]